MMTIILSACLIADPDVCKEHKLPVDGEMNVTQCAMFAPPFFAQWAESHPEWQIKKWRCEPGDLSDT